MSGAAPLPPKAVWSDPAVTMGMSVFETIGATPTGALLELDWHLERLARSAEWLGAPLKLEELEGRLLQALSAWRDAHLAGLPHPLAVRYTLSVSGQDHIAVRSYPPDYIGGSVTVAPILSPPARFLPRSVKHGNRAEWRSAARALEVDEVLLCDGSGELLEADQSSVFAIQGGRLLYPPLRDGRRLESVGLRRALRCAQSLGAPVAQGPLWLGGRYELLCLSSSLKGVARAALTGAQDHCLAPLERGALELVKADGVSEESLALWRALSAQVRAEMGVA